MKKGSIGIKWPDYLFHLELMTLSSFTSTFESLVQPKQGNN